jgi:hemerythrin
MPAFIWDEYYVTGMLEVDEQHLGLVALINRLGEHFASGRSRAQSDVERTFTELDAYARRHFEDEERHMTEHGLDPSYVQSHRLEHARFIEAVSQLRQDAPSTRADVALLDFLVSWLGWHILGMDQAMARQARAIAAGVSPAAAWAEELGAVRGPLTPLLDALHRLFEQVSARNRELRELTASLERRVARRTKELADANRRLEELALTDSLTGLPNRRAAMSALDASWASDAPTSVMMLDADGFKQVNDTWGHDAGDTVLRQLGRELRASVRTDDTVFRLGGDEFLVLCPKTPLAGACLVAERMWSAVRALRVATGEGFWEGSVSVGVAARSSATITPEDLLRAADAQVYVAKRAGRNRVSCASDG